MEFNKVSWFVTGVVCGAVAIAGVVLVANDGSLSPDMAQAECEQNVRAQVDQRVIEVLHNIDRVCQKLDKVFVVPEQAASSPSSSSKQAAMKSDRADRSQPVGTVQNTAPGTVTDLQRR